MASEGTARPKDPSFADSKLSGTRPRAPQAAREIIPPPPGPAEQVAEAPVDFEAHDTIPAPPWLDDESA